MNQKKHQSMVPIPGMKRIQNYLFKFQDLLGKGNFSTVYKGINQMTSQVVAVKYIALSSLTCQRLKELLDQQIQIFTSLNHPNIVKCYQVLKSVNNCYIITQLCNGGDLGQLLAKKRIFQEDEAAPYIKDIFQGLYYLSKKNIVHRDIKIANIFINNGKAKLADFGFAQRAKAQFYDGSIGTPLCMSPQGFLDNLYGNKTDVWAFGVILYQLTHGKLHLQHCTSQETLKKQIGIQIKMQQLKKQLSIELKDLIIRCLDVNPFSRITFQQIRNSPYLKRITKEQMQPISLQDIKFISSLHQNNYQENLKNLVSLKSFDHPHFNHLQSHQKEIIHRNNNHVDFIYGKNIVCQNINQQQEKCICKPPIKIIINQPISNNFLAQKRVSVPSLNIQQRFKQLPIQSFQSPKNRKFTFADDKQNSNVSTTDRDFLQPPSIISGNSELPFRKHKGSFDLGKNQQLNQITEKRTFRTTISAKISFDNQSSPKSINASTRYIKMQQKLPLDYNPTTNTKRLLNGFLKYNEAIGLIHYSRLLYKYIAELKATGIYHVGDLNLKYYSNFLLNILNELLQKITTDQLILSSKQDISNQQINEKIQKMVKVINQYIERYKPNLQKERAEYLNRNSGQIRHIINLDKNFIEAFTIPNKDKINRYNIAICKFTQILQNSSRYLKYTDFDSNEELQSVFVQPICKKEKQIKGQKSKLLKKDSFNAILA